MVSKQSMKQYVIDEIRPADIQTLRGYLENTFGPAEMQSIYWIPLPETCLSDIQKTHKNCQPFWFAMELGETSLSCELLVRTKNAIRCNCIGYATPYQREWLINQTDAIFEKLNIVT